jgi:hypothetical protein
LAVVAKSRPFTALEKLLHSFNLDTLIGSLEPYRAPIAYVCWSIGFCTFIYAVYLSLAAAAAIFRVAGWFDRVQQAGASDGTKVGD